MRLTTTKSTPKKAVRAAAKRRRTFNAEKPAAAPRRETVAARKRVAAPRRAPRRRLHASHYLALVLVAGAVAALAWFHLDSRFFVYNGKVVGATRYNAAQIMEASGLEGLNAFYVDPASVRDAIAQAIPGVGDVRVRCLWPNRVVVEVDERSATYVWHDGLASYLVDGSGLVFATDDGSHEGLLTFRAENGTPLKVGDQLDVAALEAGRDLNSLIPAVKTFLVGAEGGISIKNADGVRINLGKGDDLELKVATMNALLQRTASRGEPVEFIDVRFPAGVYYR